MDRGDGMTLDTLHLFPMCPAGCGGVTHDARVPCQECQDLFGPHMQRTDSGVTEEEFTQALAESEQAVREVYAARRDMVPLPGPPPARAPAPVAAATQSGPTSDDVKAGLHRVHGGWLHDDPAGICPTSNKVHASYQTSVACEDKSQRIAWTRRETSPPSPPEPPRPPEPKWLANQECWCCGERRKCRPDPTYRDRRLICKGCLEDA
jgi:hypothetical protein